ncbi:MAG: ATP-binding protein [Candidatus Bathyarchaeota archaeon]|nr:ATP-binding protein [Candidatus Bathyarchaeota archaeon]
MISIYAFFAIAATLICALLAVFVYFTNRKSNLNRAFILAITVGAYSAFTTFMVIQAESVQTAYFWNKAGFLWPFFLVLLLKFVLVFTQNRFANDKRTYILLYTPAFLFSLTDLTTDLISGPPVNTAYGYVFIGSDSPLDFATVLWSAIISVSLVAICLRHYFKVNESNKKQQVKLITIAVAYPIVVNVISKAAYFLFGLYIPYYGVGANAVLCLFIFYAIWRYNLFNLNPAIAAENIIATMPDSFILIDSNGKILRTNQAFTNLTGHKENELTGKTVNHILSGKDNQQLIDLINQKHEIKNYETTILTKNNVETPVSISASLIKYKGKNVGITLIIHDLTRLKQDEQKILKNERFAAIGELAGMVGHDLRNPLNSMQMATYYLKKKASPNMDPTSKEMLENIQAGIQYSNKIVEDLLDYSREITLKMEEATPKELAQNAMSLIRVPYGVKVVDLTEDTPTLRVDKVHISRVFVNIIKNAFEAMPKGGSLTINSTKTENLLKISFKDTGDGMSQETIGKLWKPLFTTKAKGMGFGLPICKRIMEAHGGSIQVESTPEQGTAFSLVFPVNN